jgi:hypothetical protein
MKIPGFLVGALALISCAGILRAGEPVIVHEWGTFTCLQDENGKAIGGINVDDEPVPSFVYDAGFVHNLPGTDVRVYDFGLPPYPATKGWRPADQDVTMRLETPVLYFYPPKGETASMALPLDVHVDFHGGLLSQYYPYAKMTGFPESFPFNQSVHLADCTSSLTWSLTHFGSTQKVVETPDKVWTTPREVSAPEIEVKAQAFDQDLGKWVDAAQAEHFLFYRGVGHLDSPITANSALRAKAGTAQALPNESSFISLSSPKGSLREYKASWLVDIRADGTCGFRFLSPRDEDKPSPENFHRLIGFNLKSDLSFGGDAYSSSNLAQLKTSMQAELVRAGLYPDEASAMLRTWELSYFKSPGLRLFYIVPRAWVDQVLPLKITGAPVQVTRVMVGRIELISDEQRATLARLAQGPCPDLAALKKAANDALDKGTYTKQEREDFYTGARPMVELGLTPSPGVRDYFSLGRFRDALIVHEQRVHPSAPFARFIKDNGLASLGN